MKTIFQVRYGITILGPIRLSRRQAGCLKLVTLHLPSIIATIPSMALMPPHPHLWSLPMSCPDLRSWLCKLLMMTKNPASILLPKMLSIPRKFMLLLPAIATPLMTSITMGWTRTCLPPRLLRLLPSRKPRKASSQQLQQNRNSNSNARCHRMKGSADLDLLLLVPCWKNQLFCF